jgi:cytochrome o ubiquinol oxidase subunit II
VINEQGEWEGFSANYSGAGFSHMRFKYRGVSQDEFDNWVARNKSYGKELDRAAYLELEKPTTKHPVEYYGKVEQNLFHAIVNRCVVEGTVCMDTQMMADSMRNRTNLSADELAILINEAMCTIAPNADALPLITSSKKNGYDSVSN